MTNMLLISLLLLLLLLIEQLFFVFCDISSGYSLLLKSTSFLELHAYSDANHDNDFTHRKFVTSFRVFLSDYLIYQKNKKQSIVSQSSTEIKYRVITFIIKKIISLHWLLANMRVSFSHPTPIYCDNHNSIQITHNLIFHE